MRNVFAIPVIVAFCLLLGGCDGLTTDEFVASFLEEDADLGASPDPRTRAAAKSNRNVARDKTAQQALETALRTHDPADLDPAIAEAPHDPAYHAHKAALFLAAGNIGGYYAEAGKAKGLMNAGGLDEDTQTSYMLDAFYNTRSTVEQTAPGWSLLNHFYCSTLDRYTAQTVGENDIVASIFIVTTYPSAGCP
jgi:hypothetical protein